MHRQTCRAVVLTQEDDQPLNFGALAKPPRVAAAGEVKPMARPAVVSFAEADDDRDRCSCRSLVNLHACIVLTELSWRQTAQRLTCVRNDAVQQTAASRGRGRQAPQQAGRGDAEGETGQKHAAGTRAAATAAGAAAAAAERQVSNHLLGSTARVAFLLRVSRTAIAGTAATMDIAGFGQGV